MSKRLLLTGVDGEGRPAAQRCASSRFQDHFVLESNSRFRITLCWQFSATPNRYSGVETCKIRRNRLLTRAARKLFVDGKDLTEPRP